MHGYIYGMGACLNIEVTAQVLPDATVLAGFPGDLMVVQQAQLRDDVRLRVDSQNSVPYPL